MSQLIQLRDAVVDAIKAEAPSSRGLDWPEPIGKTIRLETGQNQFTAYQVVGLVKDFHFATIHHRT